VIRRPAVSRLLPLVALVVLSALALPPAATAQTFRWDMPNEYPGTSIHGEGDQFFARTRAERSGGRVAITHYFDATLGYRSKDLLDAIGQGKVALGDMYVGALGGVDLIFLLPSLPFEAVLSSGDGGAGDRLMETLTHFTAVNYSMTMSMVTMNLDTWKSLPPDLQAAVRSAAEATSERQWKEIVSRVTANYARMRARGTTIVTELSPEYERGLRAGGQVAVDEWLARMGPAGKDILDRYRARLATSTAGGGPSAGGTR
jgi:TRAP-type C4-dicarboxylate transport system substrate-binding protein